MKLTLRARALGKKFTLITTAYVLAVSSLTASVPFILSSRVDAAPGVFTTHAGFNTLTDWQTDRAPVSGGVARTNSTLTYNLDGDTPDSKAANNAFYKTEGQNASLPANVSSFKASLYLDPAWENTTSVRAGVWGVTSDPSYPILEFSNRNDTNDQVPGEARIQAWATGIGWIPTTVKINYGSTYIFEVVHNQSAGKYEYYVNDVLVASASAGSQPLTRIIFNSYNAGIANNDYSVKWSDFSVGTKAPDAPTNVRINRGSTLITSGTTVDAGFIAGNVVLNFNPVTGANKYITEIKYPGGSKEVSNNYNNTWLIKNDAPAQGEFSVYGEGAYTYRVKSLNTVTGAFSEWSSPVTLVYDLTPPQVELLSPANAVINSTSATLSVKATDNLAVKKITANIYKKDTGLLYKSTSKNVEGTAVEAIHSVSLATLIGGNPLPDGLYFVKYNATDQNNRISSTKTFDFRVDSTLPTVIFQSDNNIKIATSQPAATVSGTTPIRLRVDGEQDGTLIDKYIYIDGNLIDNYKSTHRNRDFQLNTISLNLADGVHVLSGKAIDEAGNTTDATPVSFIVDNTKPTVKVNLNRASYVSTGAAISPALQNPEIEASDANLDRIELSKNGKIVNTWNSTTQQRRANIGFLGEGAYTIRAYDKIGLVSDSFEFTIDRTAPVVSITSPSEPLFVGNNAQVAIEAIVGDAVSYRILRDSTELLNTPTPYATYNWNTAGLASGTYTITVEARDAANNITTDSIVVSVDNSPPSVDFSLAEGAILSGNVSIPGSTDGEEDTYQFTVYDLDDNPVLVAGSGITNVAFNTSSLANGSYYAEATAKDEFGNIAISERVEFSIFNQIQTESPDTNSEDEGATDTSDGAGQSGSGAPVNGGFPFTNFGVANVLGLSDDADNSSDSNSADDADVEGIATANTLAAAVDNTDGKAFGLAWYWWLLIIAAVAGAIWWIVGAVRSRQAE